MEIKPSEPIKLDLASLDQSFGGRMCFYKTTFSLPSTTGINGPAFTCYNDIIMAIEKNGSVCVAPNTNTRRVILEKRNFKKIQPQDFPISPPDPLPWKKVIC